LLFVVGLQTGFEEKNGVTAEKGRKFFVTSGRQIACPFDGAPGGERVLSQIGTRGKDISGKVGTFG